MKTVIVQVSVECPDDTDPSDVAGAINKMLDIGYADACDTQGSDLANEDSELAANLTIGQPEAWLPARAGARLVDAPVATRICDRREAITP
jgi:hypothetical protein